MVKVKTTGERVFQSEQEVKTRKEKIAQLAKASNLPEHMGELLLSEIRLSTDDTNKQLRERAELLGLM
jgi:hypothetical protein